MIILIELQLPLALRCYVFASVASGKTSTSPTFDRRDKGKKKKKINVGVGKVNGSKIQQKNATYNNLYTSRIYNYGEKKRIKRSDARNSRQRKGVSIHLERYLYSLVRNIAG